MSSGLSSGAFGAPLTKEQMQEQHRIAAAAEAHTTDFGFTPPERESDDHAVLAAWYSGFAFNEHYRKCVLAQCRELVRADYALREEKVSEARLDDLGRLHPLYLDYLARHLHGRTLWEQEVMAMGGGR